MVTREDTLPKSTPDSLWTRVWSIGWAPLSVIALHAVLAAVFGHRREVDPICHVLGGGAGAYCLLRSFTLFRKPLDPISTWPRGITVLLLMLGVAVLWELAEFGSDRVLGTHIQQGALDTGSDIGLGVAGAAVVVMIDNIASRRVLAARG